MSTFYLYRVAKVRLFREIPDISKGEIDIFSLGSLGIAWVVTPIVIIFM